MSLNEELFWETARTEPVWGGTVSSGTAVFVITYEKTIFKIYFIFLIFSSHHLPFCYSSLTNQKWMTMGKKRHLFYSIIQNHAEKKGKEASARLPPTGMDK